MQDEEQRLAQGLRAGRIDAWQALHDAYAERLWRGVARLLGPGCADVADVVQETMMAAARSARRFDPGRGSLWQWLWGIARNHAILHLRKQERRQRLARAVAWLAASDGQVLGWLDGKQPSPAEGLETAELATLVRATLAALPAEYEMLLTARYLDGEPVALIAGRENASEAAVRSKLARARAAFRAAFCRYAQESEHEPA